MKCWNSLRNAESRYEMLKLSAKCWISVWNAQTHYEMLNLSMKCSNSLRNAESQYEMLKLTTKCWIPAFSAHGSRGIIVAVQVGAVKIYVAAAVEALRKKRKTGVKLRKIDGFLSFNPSWMLMYLFAGFFFNLTLCMTKLRVLVLSFPDFTDISIEFLAFKKRIFFGEF